MNNNNNNNINLQVESSISAINRPQHEWDAMNAAAEATLACQTRTMVEHLRPANTAYAYDPKQKQFKQWCKDVHYPNDFVTELRVIRFVDYINQRGIIVKQKNENGTVSEFRKDYSFETLKQYIKACVDLHNKQKSSNQGTGISLVHPRGEDLKNFESNLKKSCALRTVNNYEDPGVNSIQDGYSTEQLVLIANYYLGINKNVCNALRDRMVFLLNHMMMLRGETLRDTNLNHLFSLDFKDEGSQRCPAFVMMITSGKTNQENHKLYSGVIRHKNPLTCAFGAVGFYLFHRFHIFGEVFPDFSMNENWFDTKLARGQKLDKSVSYPTQLKSINKAFDFVGINSRKKTHSCRQAGARDAEMAGLTNDHIRRVGRWNNDSLQNNYLDCLPRPAIRVMQGFPEAKGCFWLARNLVTPPLSFQKMIFPEVEEWQQKMRDDESIQTICGEGFLSLLVELRTIIIQDAVVIRQIFPDHGIFQHEIFQSAEFNSFSESLLLEIETATPPSEVEIQRVLPFINERIDHLSHQVNANNNNNNNSICPILEKLQQSVDNISTRLDSIDARHSMKRKNGQNDEQRVRRRIVVEEEDEDSEEEDENEEIGQDNINESLAIEQTEMLYELNRNNLTVNALWKEWTVGLTDALPSVNYLNEKYNTKWRRSTKERQYYSKRLVIIKEIHRISEQENISLENAVERLEQERRSVPGGCSLDKFSKLLSKKNKQ